MSKNKVFVFYLSTVFLIGFKVQAEIPEEPNLQEQQIADFLHGLFSDREIESLKQNLQKYPKYINVPNDNGHSLLHRAVRSNNIETVEFLLSQGAKVNFQHFLSEGDTALHYSKAPEITQKLIDHGAVVNVLNAHKVSPLLKHVGGNGLTSENIHILLKARADVNAVSFKRNTALHLLFVMTEEYLDRRILLEPLQKQRLDNVRLQVAKDLLAHKIDVKAVNKEGSTALHYAARAGHIKAIPHLVLNGADINAVDKKRQTPIMHAFGVRNMEAVEMLLVLGARSDIPNYRGYSLESILRRNKNEDSRFPKLVAIIDQLKRGRPRPACVSPLIAEQMILDVI